MVEFRSLHWEELNQWFDHCASVFTQGEHTDGMRRYFMNHWYNDSQRKIAGIHVALVDGQIASTIRVFHRSIYLNGRIVAMGGIGEVSTKPQYRRQGMSGKLLQMSIEYMEKAGMAISSLGTGIPRHYARYGWVPVKLFYGQAKVTAVKDGNTKLMDWDDPGELHQVISCYDQYARAFNGPMVRDEMYWQRWIRTEAGRAWVLKEGDHVTAYLIARQSEGVVRVQDFAAAGSEAESFQRLIAHAVWSFGLSEAEVTFPGAIRSGLTEVKTEAKDGLMYRIVDRVPLGITNDDDLERMLHGGEIRADVTKLLVPSIDSF